MQVFHATPEQHLIPAPQQLTHQWWSWMTNLMQLTDHFRWCIGNQVSCYWLLINEWKPVMWEQLWRSEHENHCLLDCVHWIHEESTLLSEPHWDKILAVQGKTSGQKCHYNDFVLIPGGCGLELLTCNSNGTNAFILIQLIQESLVTPFFYPVITLNQFYLIHTSFSHGFIYRVVMTVVFWSKKPTFEHWKMNPRKLDLSLWTPFQDSPEMLSRRSERAQAAPESVWVKEVLRNQWSWALTRRSRYPLTSCVQREWWKGQMCCWCDWLSSYILPSSSLWQSFLTVV